MLQEVEPKSNHLLVLHCTKKLPPVLLLNGASPISHHGCTVAGYQKKLTQKLAWKKNSALYLHLTKWLNQMDNIVLIEQNTEEKILAAARKVFVNKGFTGARMQEIADEAGINKALLHYYFRNKNKLFEQIFQEAFGKLMPGLSEIFTRPISIFEKIELFTHTYISMVIEQPYIPVFVLSEIHRNPDEFFNTYVKPAFVTNLQVVGKEFAMAIETGQIRPIDPKQLMINIMSLCIFPFAARPMLQRVMHITDAAFAEMLELRKQEVSAFIIRAIQPNK